MNNKPQSALEPSEPRMKLGNSGSSNHAHRASQASAVATTNILQTVSRTDPEPHRAPDVVKGEPDMIKGESGDQD
jgi:hypothetical protein